MIPLPRRSREWKIERLPPTPGAVIVTPRGLLDATTGRVAQKEQSK